jgi:16S rRNA (cytosine967-C5)-methyltransferase
VVLCDVPCSGSGTYRRDPEAKWRLRADALDRLLRTQADILRMAQAHVRPGGRLVYMTCSLFAVENEAQIAVFLEENPDWRATQSVLQSPLELSDGFFHAVLQAP